MLVLKNASGNGSCDRVLSLIHRGIRALIFVKISGIGLGSCFSGGYSYTVYSAGALTSTVRTTHGTTEGKSAILLSPYYTDFSLFGGCRSHKRGFGTTIGSVGG